MPSPRSAASPDAQNARFGMFAKSQARNSASSESTRSRSDGSSASTRAYSNVTPGNVPANPSCALRAAGSAYAASSSCQPRRPCCISARSDACGRPVHASERGRGVDLLPRSIDVAGEGGAPHLSLHRAQSHRGEVVLGGDGLGLFTAALGLADIGGLDGSDVVGTEREVAQRDVVRSLGELQQLTQCLAPNEQTVRPVRQRRAPVQRLHQDGLVAAPTRERERDLAGTAAGHFVEEVLLYGDTSENAAARRIVAREVERTREQSLALGSGDTRDATTSPASSRERRASSARRRACATAISTASRRVERSRGSPANCCASARSARSDPRSRSSGRYVSASSNQRTAACGSNSRIASCPAASECFVTFAATSSPSAALQCAASIAGDVPARSNATATRRWPAARSRGRQVGDERLAEQLVGEVVRVHRAGLEHVRSDRAIDEVADGRDVGVGDLGEELHGEVGLEDRCVLQQLGGRTTELGGAPAHDVSDPRRRHPVVDDALGRTSAQQLGEHQRVPAGELVQSIDETPARARRASDGAVRRCRRARAVGSAMRSTRPVRLEVAHEPRQVRMRRSRTGRARSRAPGRASAWAASRAGR